LTCIAKRSVLTAFPLLTRARQTPVMLRCPLATASAKQLMQENKRIATVQKTKKIEQTDMSEVYKSDEYACSMRLQKKPAEYSEGG